MFDHGQYDFNRSKQSCLQKLSEKHPIAQVSSVSLVDEANSFDHIVLFPIMLSYTLRVVPSSITFLSSWHCSMSKPANYWPFIKTFKKNIHMNNIRFSWCCFDSLKGIMCIIWNHGPVPGPLPRATGIGVLLLRWPEQALCYLVSAWRAVKVCRERTNIRKSFGCWNIFCRRENTNIN